MKVFLSGNPFGSDWKNYVIKNIKADYYNPDKEIDEELINKEKNSSDFCLYVVTPLMKGFTVISEVSDDSNKRPSKTIFCFIEKDENKEFSKFQIKSLTAVAKLVKGNGGYWFNSLDEAIAFINSQVK